LLAIVLLIPLILITVAVGVFLGWITATLLRADRSTVLWDALWAPLAFLVVGYLAIAIPCRGCEYVRNGWTLRNHVPYPDVLAYGAACAVPVLHQILRRLKRGPN
jgi:hypothetical protein